MEDARMKDTAKTLRLCAKLLDAIGEHEAAKVTREVVALAEGEEKR